MIRSSIVVMAILHLSAATNGGVDRPFAPGLVKPGPNCRPSCAVTCDRLSCEGLNVSQCQSLRLACRAQCRSRC